MTAFFAKEWKFIAVFLLILAVLAVGYYEYRHGQQAPVAALESITTAAVEKALAKLGQPNSPTQAAAITERIIERQQSPPDVAGKAASSQDADQKAQAAAKKDNPDFILKNTLSDALGRTNYNYYGVHTEKNSALWLGLGADRGTGLYQTVSYSYKKVRLDVDVKVQSQQTLQGGRVMYKVAEW
ncbi:MAG: hypothetical protein P4N41_25760 [Negativicutes bacterium]|nr:hypothetical protein [Negativicutes bacterium]MDR3593082.1 hypothetical protein [Negativicutes bacterium]